MISGHGGNRTHRKKSYRRSPQEWRKVRALGRSESKLAALKRAGADGLIGYANDATFLTNAFTGADAVYTLLTSNPQSPDYRANQDQEG